MTIGTTTHEALIATIDAIDATRGALVPADAGERLTQALAGRGAAVVRLEHLTRLVQLMGGIPGGATTPSLRGHGLNRLAGHDELDDYLEQVLAALAKSLENVRAICADLNEDRLALNALHRDIAATGRILNIALADVLPQTTAITAGRVTINIPAGVDDAGVAVYNRLAAELADWLDR